MFEIIKHTTILRHTRANMIRLISNLDEEQLNAIPEGFNNNIAWNFIHCVRTQQALIYGLSDVRWSIDAAPFVGYAKGDVPTDHVSEALMDQHKDMAVETIESLERDYKEGIFEKFKAYPTSYGVTLESVQDAIRFNNVHEGLHLGSIMALKKLV